MTAHLPPAWRALFAGFAISFAIFVSGCCAIYLWHTQISESIVGTYALVGLTGLSAIVWPIFAVRLISAAIHSGVAKGRSRRHR